MDNNHSQSNYAGLTSNELYSYFSRSNWTGLNESQRLDLLQEVADRQAAANGDKYSVTVSFENMDSSTSGYEAGNHIYLNRDMFVNDRVVESYGEKTIEFKLTDSNWQALETVLHEGEHALQDNISNGTVEADDATKALFQSNNFTVSDVDGNRASQYMLGKNNYAFYYLNPSELDAFKTSQDQTQAIIASLQSQGLKDSSMDQYLAELQKNGYEAKLNEYRSEFGNENVDKEVAAVLKNTYFNTNEPVDKNIEKAVKSEMIESQKALDRENKMSENRTVENQTAENKTEGNGMAKQVYEQNGFTYTVDENGTITGEGKVAADKGVDCGKRPDPPGLESGDDRGHVIAAGHGGANEPYNMTAQDRHMNRSEYKTVENSERSLAKEGYDVHTSKTAFVSDPSGRPDAYMINDTITSPDGKTQNVHLSFQNMSQTEQEENNQFLDSQIDLYDAPNPDPLRDSMSKEEYTQLMEETDAALPSVKDEFDMDSMTSFSFDQSFDGFANGNTYTGDVDSGVQGGDTGVSADSGVGFGSDSDSGVGTDSGGMDSGSDAGASVDI